MFNLPSNVQPQEAWAIRYAASRDLLQQIDGCLEGLPIEELTSLGDRLAAIVSDLTGRPVADIQRGLQQRILPQANGSTQVSGGGSGGKE